MGTQATESSSDGKQYHTQHYIGDCQNGGPSAWHIELADVVVHSVLYIGPLSAHNHWHSPLGEPSNKIYVLDLNLENLGANLENPQIGIPHTNNPVQ